MGIQGESKTDQMFLLLETQKTARIKFNWNLLLYKAHYSQNSSSDRFIYYLYLHLPSRVGDTSSHLAQEENGWFIQVNSVSATACVDFPYGVSVPLHCIFPTHTLYTAFHVEGNHSHLFSFRGQICGTIRREGSVTCMRREVTYMRKCCLEGSVIFNSFSFHCWKMGERNRSRHRWGGTGKNAFMDTWAQVVCFWKCKTWKKKYFKIYCDVKALGNLTRCPGPNSGMADPAWLCLQSWPQEEIAESELMEVRIGKQQRARLWFLSARHGLKLPDFKHHRFLLYFAAKLSHVSLWDSPSLCLSVMTIHNFWACWPFSDKSERKDNSFSIKWGSKEKREKLKLVPLLGKNKQNLSFNQA